MWRAGGAPSEPSFTFATRRAESRRHADLTVGSTGRDLVERECWEECGGQEHPREEAACGMFGCVPEK